MNNRILSDGSCTANLYSTGTVDETGHSQRVHRWCDQADQPRRGNSHVRHPATVAVTMYNRVNDLEVAFSGDDYQAVHRPVYSWGSQRVALDQKADQLPQNARLLTIRLLRNIRWLLNVHDAYCDAFYQFLVFGNKRLNSHQVCRRPIWCDKLNLQGLYRESLRTPVFVFKYPDICRPKLTVAKNAVTRSRTVWLQTKMLVVFLVPCLYTRRQISIARLAMKAKRQMNKRKASTIGWAADKLGEVMMSSAVVLW